MLPGVYKAKKKNGSTYYRANISHKGKHISLGSYDTEEDCFLAYSEAKKLFTEPSITLLSYQNYIHFLDFDKVISIINFRDNGIYINNPIYLQRNYFVYYLTPITVLKFDNDDLFYYTSHRILSRGGHWYVNEYGMQYSILARYGIRPYAVKDRDYRFANGDDTDLRYSNIIVINKYYGVERHTSGGTTEYIAKIHLNGDFIVGRYPTEAEAAVAYNKAADYCIRQGIGKQFPQNYVTELTPREYADTYTELKISSKIKYYFRNKGR